MQGAQVHETAKGRRIGGGRSNLHVALVRHRVGVCWGGTRRADSRHGVLEGERRAGLARALVRARPRALAHDVLELGQNADGGGVRARWLDVVVAHPQRLARDLGCGKAEVGSEAEVSSRRVLASEWMGKRRQLALGITSTSSS